MLIFGKLFSIFYPRTWFVTNANIIFWFLKVCFAFEPPYWDEYLWVFKFSTILSADSCYVDTFNSFLALSLALNNETIN